MLMKQLIQKSNQKGILHFGTFFLILFGVGLLSFGDFSPLAGIGLFVSLTFLVPSLPADSESLGLVEIHLDSLEFTWIHLDSLGFTRIHMVSHGSTWSHLARPLKTPAPASKLARRRDQRNRGNSGTIGVRKFTKTHQDPPGVSRTHSGSTRDAPGAHRTTFHSISHTSPRPSQGGRARARASAGGRTFRASAAQR